MYWKPIKGYEEKYELNNFGRVRHLGTERYINGSLFKNGYYYLTLYMNKIPKKYLVHRLIALHFIENNNPGKYNFINHKDGIKTNNSIDNLEWCTHQQNMQHANKTGLRKYPKNKGNKRSKKIINTITKSIYNTLREASEVEKINENTLFSYLNGKCKNKTSLIYIL